MTARQKRRLQRKLARRPDLQHQPEHQLPTIKAPMQQISEAPVSDAKLAANRANAQLSTGPTTTTGKQIASQNSTRHGLTGTFCVLPDESQPEFDRLLKELLRDEAPVGAAEIEMVEQMAQAIWLSRRSLRLQDKCLLALQSGDPEQERLARKDLALYLRYMTTHDRAFVRFSVELRKCRNERRRAERGFVSQKLREAAEERRKANFEARKAVENRKQERHEMKMRLQRARCERLEGAHHAPKAASATS